MDSQPLWVTALAERSAKAGKKQLKYNLIASQFTKNHNYEEEKHLGPVCFLLKKEHP